MNGMYHLIYKKYPHLFLLIENLIWLPLRRQAQ